MHKIEDQFTALAAQGVSRQRIYQLRQQAKGLCRKGDGRKVFKWKMCKHHVLEQLRQKRDHYAKFKKKPPINTHKGTGNTGANGAVKKV